MLTRCAIGCSEMVHATWFLQHSKIEDAQVMKKYSSCIECFTTQCAAGKAEHERLSSPANDRPRSAAVAHLRGQDNPDAGDSHEPVRADRERELLGGEAGHALPGQLGGHPSPGGLSRHCLHQECPCRPAGQAASSLSDMHASVQKLLAMHGC